MSSASPDDGLFATLAAAADDAVEAVGRSPLLMIGTFWASLVLRLLDDRLYAAFADSAALRNAWGVVATLLVAIVSTPLVISVSRRVVLAERQSSFTWLGRLDLAGETCAAGCLAALVAVGPLAIMLSIQPAPETEIPRAVAALMLAGLLGAILWVVVVMVRLIAFTAAVAVEEPDAGLISAWRATRGDFWRIAGLLAPYVALLFLAERTSDVFWLFGVELDAVSEAAKDDTGLRLISASAVDAIVTAFLAGLAARVYLWSVESGDTA